MNRHEYIETINRTLSGRVKPDVQQETVKYYKEYIDSQIVKGTEEAMVLATLGDPALLAKTVIASQPEPYGDEAGVRQAVPESVKKAQDRKLILILIVVLIVLFLALGLVFKVVYKLLPIIVPVGIIVWAVKKLRS
ncbi:MAG: DUF1700 domain-containing protein [Lachnospiraceae bacterium]|nr:DUF1700 domain-containing protein [Lachnospiraceae bacterium]